MKRHPFDAVSMVFGLLFVGLGSLYLSGNEVDDLVIRFWPAALVVLGLAILFSARRSDEVPAAPASPSTPAAPVAGPSAPAREESPEPAPPEEHPDTARPAE